METMPPAKAFLTMMDTQHAHPKSPSISRRCFLCGAQGLALSAAALAVMPELALADSNSQERAIGVQVYNDLRQKNQILEQSPYYSVVRSVGARISRAAAPHWYTMNFIIVKGDKANAFSVPGGWVYVNETLLRNAENEEELASVLGHETGHIVLGHVMNRLHQAQNLNIMFAIGSLFVRSQGAANLFNVAELTANYGFLNFSRQQEYQADHEGVILANGAGYNPWGMVWFFQKLEKLYGNSGFEQFVQDHPATKDRIARIESFFSSDQAAFGKWSRTIAARPGLSLDNTNSRLVLN